MGIILVAKILLELYFFVGIVGQYGEEDLFVSLALPAKEQGWSYWNSIRVFRRFPSLAEWRGDPINMYPFRVAALYPNILFMRLLGPSERSLVVWTAITGIGTVLLVGLIGRSLVDEKAGLFSASVLSLIPGHILYSARVDTDMPQLFFLCLSVLLLVTALKTGNRRRQVAFAAASGFSIGLLYLAKLLPSFLVLAWALPLPFLLVLLRDRETLVAPGGKLRQAVQLSALVLGGFALVFAVENCAYYFLSGHWFLHARIMKANAVNIDSWRSAQSVTFGLIRFWLPPGRWDDLFSHAEMFWLSLRPVGWVGSIYSMPIHGWSGVALIPALLVVPFLRVGCRKLLLLVLLGFGLYYVYQEFLWLYPTIEEGKLNLTYVHKVHRFVFPCYAGIALCIGTFLGSILRAGSRCRGAWPRRSLQWLPLGFVLAFAIANYPATKFFHRMLHTSLDDLRQVCAHLHATAPDGANVFVTASSESFYRLLQYPRNYEWRYFVDVPFERVCGGWGVVGGSLGLGLSSDGLELGYPKWLQPYYFGKEPAPKGWQLLGETPSSFGSIMTPVRILRLPECSAEVKP